MSKLLSQEEIDALLSQEKSPELAPVDDGLAKEKDIRRYDFKHPDRVSKDQSKILRNIHDAFARLLSTYLSNSLRTMIDVKSPILEQVTNLEFTMSAADFTNMYIFEIEKLDGKAILEIDPNLTFFVIDRLFGGAGGTIGKSQQITVIESSVMQNIAKKILENFQESWEQVDHLEPRIVQFETNPQLVTIAPSSETMIVLNFPIIARTFEFYIVLAFPYFMMEPILKKMLSQNYMTLLKKKSSQEDVDTIKNILEHTRIPISLELGKTYLTVHEFIDLREDDVLVLDRKTNEYLTTKVANVSKFYTTAGTSGKNLALKIEYLLDEEGDIVNEWE